MSKPIDHSSYDLPEQSGSDVASLLLKMQRQLVFLEKKIDSLIYQLQEGQPRGSSSDKPFRKKPFSRTASPAGHSRRYENKEWKEKPGKKDSDQGFYSRFSKTEGNRGSGPRKKPFHHKQKNRE